MAILFTDLIPANKDLIEKNTLHHGRSLNKEDQTEAKDTHEKTEGIISQIPLESPLEIELARVRYTQDEIEKTKQERIRRLHLSQQMRANAWSKKIKSKSYRKVRREEKQRKEAEKIQINMLTEKVDEVNAQEEEQEKILPEIVKAQETAYNFIRNTINPEPVSIEQIHTQTTPTTKNQETLKQKIDKLDDQLKINSLLDIDQDEFFSEKQKAQNIDKPWEKEEVLPGWNTWGGASLSPVKKSSNTTKVIRSGIEIRKRKDFAVSHVIYNEKSHLTRNKKYAISRLPYGYANHEEYSEVMSFPIDNNHQPTVILNKLIKEDKEKKKHL